MTKNITKQQIEEEFSKYSQKNNLGRTVKGWIWDLDKAQKQVRYVQAYKCKRGVIHCNVRLPQCYVNKKVKVVIA